MSQLSFRAHHSALARLWHWADLAVVTGLLITVLLRKTVLSARGNATLIQSQLQDLGATVTPDQSKKVAALLRDNLWDWHVTWASRSRSSWACGSSRSSRAPPRSAC